MGVIKQTRPGFNQQPITFKKFSDRINLCAFTQLSEYIKRTEQYRSTGQNLFLGTVKPFRSATVDTLSNWVRFDLIKCYLSEYSPLSLRGAGTSAALRSNNLTVDTIMSAAGWSQNSTFQKLYDQPLAKDSSLDVAILSNKVKTD